MSYVVIGEAGPPCPRCGRPMQIRKHRRIGSKQLRQPYYFRLWFYCTHRRCKTTTVVREEFKVWNGDLGRRLEAIEKQLRPRD